MYRKAAIWIFAGLLYLLWPYDVIPDFLWLVGWIDDLLIAGLAIYMAAKAFKKKLEVPHPRRRRPIDDDDVIDVDIEKD